MKSALIFLTTCFFVITGPSLEAKPKYRVFTPNMTGKSVFLKSGAKRHKYFVVEKGASFGFNVSGPTTVKIRTRAELRSGITDAEYKVEVWEGDHLVEGRKVTTKPSQLTIEGDKGQIAVARTVFLKVPKGKHGYRIWISSEKIDKFYARYYQTTKKPKKVEFSTFKPYEFKKRVTLSSGKNSVNYYLIDSDGGATLSVIGPTRLKIYCRAGFTEDMKGTLKFTLGLFEKGNQVVQFPGVAKATTKSSFKELSDIVPSKLYTYVFDVPDGKHVYEVKKINSASPNLAVRFKITKVALGMVP